MRGPLPLLWRLAGRTARDERWRSALMVALLALSVAAASTVAISHRTLQPSAEEHWAASHGSADARVERWTHGTATVPTERLPGELQEIVAARPQPDSELPSVKELDAAVREVADEGAVLQLGQGSSQTGDLGFEVIAGDVSDPLAEGLVLGDVEQPLAEDEVLLSPSLREALGVEVGEEVFLGALGRLEVVGEVAQSTGGLLGAHHLAVVSPAHRDGLDRAVWLLDSELVSTSSGAAGPGPATPGSGTGELETALSEALDTESPEDLLGGQWAATGHVQITTRGTQDLRPGIARTSGLVGALVAIVLLVQVGLVGAATFATGARRRVRELGLLVAAGGASPRHIRRLVRRQAWWLGAAGATLGILLALTASFAGTGVLERIAGRPLGGPDLALGDLLVPAALGWLAAGLAAWWPARTVARVPVVTALAGRVPLRRLPRWLAPASIGVAVLGAALIIVHQQLTVGGQVGEWFRSTALARPGGTGLGSLARGVVLFAGVTLTIIGGAALSLPLLQAAGRVASRLRLPRRLALRDSVRQRSRSAATVAATMAVLVVPVYALAATATSEARMQDRNASALDEELVAVTGPVHRTGPLPPTEAMIDDARDQLPTEISEVVQLPTIGGPHGSDGQLQVKVRTADRGAGTGDTAPSVAGLAASGSQIGVLSDELRALLDLEDVREDTAIIARGLGSWEQGIELRLRLEEAQPPGGVGLPDADEADPPGQDSGLSDLPTDEIPAVASTLLQTPRVPDVLIPPSLLADADIEPTSAITLASLERPLTGPERDALRESADDRLYSIQLTSTAPESRLGGLFAAAGGASVVVALVIAGLTALLAATETDRDLRTMAAIGAQPATRPRVRAWQAGWHALLAATLAVPVGLLLFWAVQLRTPAPAPASQAVQVPWGWLLALIVLAPPAVGLPFRWLSRPTPAPVRSRRLT